MSYLKVLHFFLALFRQTSDIKRKCIRTSETECDVTDLLRNVKETYTAHILSVMPAEMDNFEEPPFAVSEKFTPYNQSK